ncbi:hypothetical protein ACFWHT_04625 [Microbacterium sp. NPDC058342]|uniref:hypothetical protein n=1 Tax=Microbacterium sp. NPDC058342 TaxID=3346454 RepID=UPI0036565B15
MPAEQIAFQITYASVDSGDGADPTIAVERILREQRVLAATRGFDGESSIVLIPVTESGGVVSVDDAGHLRFDLSTTRLEALFAEEGLTLHLGGTDDALEEVDAELEQEYGEAFEQLDDPSGLAQEELGGFGMPDDADEFTDDLFRVEPVQVAEFSRRGPWAARLTAQLLDTEVDHLEAGSWSLCRYRTDRAHGALSGGRADLPVIEVNIPAGGDAWIEVTAPHGRSALFWPNGERLTRPVLDFDSIAVPESAEVYRRMLSEADGVREELAELELGEAVDAEAVLRACLPEALGGIVGEKARLRAFVAAFGVTGSLVDAGFEEATGARRFVPRGWGRTVGDLVIGGVLETTPLTHRDRPVARFARLLRERPLLGAAISIAELAAGVVLRRRSRFGRGLGVLLIIDAVADLLILAIRMRRR